jgi:hypothetical protein
MGSPLQHCPTQSVPVTPRSGRQYISFVHLRREPCSILHVAWVILPDLRQGRLPTDRGTEYWRPGASAMSIVRFGTNL